MIAQPSGLIGLPLRLLAREVFGRLVQRVGADAVALITGEEKIVPPTPRFWVSTVEAMPLDLDTEFVAIDEVQLAGDLERGHVFTDRLLNLRGRSETLLLGAATVRPLLEKLIPGINVVTRPRMSVLTYAGSKKITRLPRRSAAVAFSASEVYAIAELIRRQRGGAAVVLGSLSPRTRNAQVELFQNGDVEHLVATDAIGMGLNLDVDHIAFAGNRKFDGYQYRQLTRSEMGQIAGRAGRHTRDGTFGVTGRVDPLDNELVDALECHRFDALKVLQWRNPQLDFTSLDRLIRSLEQPPGEEGLAKAPPAEDQSALEHAARDPDIRRIATSRERIELLWDVCQVPDYRKIAPANHADLIASLYGHITRDGVIPDEWFGAQVSFADRIDGDIDTLANRIAHIRTWTFVANRADWLGDPAYWQGVTRSIEDRLSDALHEKLTQRFVDRRTSVLMRRLRENAMLETEINQTGDVLVEGQHIGQLQGFRFAPDAAAEGPDGKTVRAAAQKALVSEIERRAEKLSKAPNEEFALSTDGTIRWQGEIVARLIAGETVLAPGFVILADETLTGPLRDKVQERISLWIKAHIGTLLKPLHDLEAAEGMEGLARGVAFRIVEGLGILERQDVAEDVRQLDQGARASMRKLGVRFGAYHIYVPALLKPAPSQLIAQLWALKHGEPDMPGLNELPQLSASGRTSIPVDPEISRDLFKVVGFRVCGPRAVRIDILERLADLIRPLIAWKPIDKSVEPPEGAIAEGGGFTVTVAMTSLLGCAGEDFSAVLRSLGYRSSPREVTRPTKAKPEDGASAETPASEEKPAQEPQPVKAEAQSGEETPETTEAVTDPAEAASQEAEAPQTEEAPAAAQEETPAASDAPAEAPAAEAPATETAASEGALAESAEGEDTVMETLTVEVWRPGRGDRRSRNRQEGQRQAGRHADGGTRDGNGEEGRENRNARGPRRGKPGRSGPGHGPGKGAGKGAGKGGGKPHSGQRKSAPPREKRADPDSPFAALAALKADLEKGGSGKS
ncbi:helicase [Rhizobiales bacterium]|nr:helicase [Hongsoonwoonella zoysiae]